MESQSNQFKFTKLADAWDSPIVARSQIGKFSGGLLVPSTIRNCDSLGIGPSGRLKFGRLVAYEKYALAEWMQAKMDAA